jgi:hypothetical protein
VGAIQRKRFPFLWTISVLTMQITLAIRLHIQELVSSLILTFDTLSVINHVSCMTQTLIHSK